MNLEFILHAYNDKKTQHKLIKVFNKTILDVRRKFRLDGKWINYEIANHLQGRYIHNTIEGNELIANAIKAGKPAMIARFGRSEFNIIQYFYERKNTVLQIKYPECLIREAGILPGIFDFDNNTLIRFSSEAINYLRDVDILTVWNCFASPEYYTTKVHLLRDYASNDIKITTTGPICNGMFLENTWTQYLQGKKVLVIHPFTDTIAKQYAIREKLFKNNKILPDFDLKLIKAPQGIGENNLKEKYGTWFNALDDMKEQMENTDFDICLIGAGAYGYHLAHHAKVIGKIGIHVAGALQLLFGIKGTRWILNSPDINQLINDNWVFPAEHEYPVNNAEYIKGEGNNAYW